MRLGWYVFKTLQADHVMLCECHVHTIIWFLSSYLWSDLCTTVTLLNMEEDILTSWESFFHLIGEVFRECEIKTGTDSQQVAKALNDKVEHCLRGVMRILDLVSSAIEETEESVTKTDKGKKAVKDNWLTIGDIVLKKKHRQEVTFGKELTDMPVNAYQLLLKSKLPKLHGLQNILLQDKNRNIHVAKLYKSFM